MKSLLNVLALVAVVGTNVVFGADETMWKRVQRLEPGARVKITLEGAAPVERYFVQVNDTKLIVLNLSAPDLPKRQLLNMAIDNPSWIAGTSKTTYRDNSLRIGPDGLFVKDKKVAQLDQVVEWIPREKVTAVQK
jgi:hypothetical protein